MLPATILAKKRDGRSLSDAEIRGWVRDFTAGAITDYQMAAFAMAVTIRGMDADETAALTAAMLDSGDSLGRRDRSVPRVDKHSTGGLGDKVSLILAPLLACHDVQVPMISGRGLGHTGGTLDKLEAIPGFRTELDDRSRDAQLDSVGCFIIAADRSLAPADRRLYAIRDVTATVESIALITASILSKKLAESLDALVMDVKVGSAAFMKTTDQARELATSLIGTGGRLGLPVTALLTDMDQPLGRAVGNAIEVNEAIDCLAGDGPAEVRELTIRLAAEALVAAGRVATVDSARESLARSLDDGSAHERFARMVAAQGGRLERRLPLAKPQRLVAEAAGYVAAIDCQSLGELVVQLGGGRRRAEDTIDPSVGFESHVRIGDRVEPGDPLLTIYVPGSNADRVSVGPAWLEAIHLSDESIARRPLVIDRITADSHPTSEPAASRESERQ